jgi:hypothetical protein
MSNKSVVMKMKLNDRQDLNSLRREMENALEGITEKFGIAFSIGGISYQADGSEAHTKLTMLAVSEKGEVVTPEMKELAMMARILPWLDEEAIKEPFNHAGEFFVLTGYKSRSRKYPFLAKSQATGKIYKFPESVIKGAYAAAVVA